MKSKIKMKLKHKKKKKKKEKKIEKNSSWTKCSIVKIKNKN